MTIGESWRGQGEGGSVDSVRLDVEMRRQKGRLSHPLVPSRDIAICHGSEIYSVEYLQSLESICEEIFTNHWKVIAK